MSMRVSDLPVLCSQCPAISPAVNVLLTSVIIAPANSNRRGFIIYNNSANSVYVTLGSTSVAANCTRLIPTFASWEFYGALAYTGVISAIRNAGTGVCTVFEFIP